MHTCIHPTTIFNLKTKRKRTYIQLASSSAWLVVHQIKQTESSWVIWAVATSTAGEMGARRM